ncbi:MAG: cysteine desulfurase [Myxococcales bacterium]|nr:cysteine desulfurase [Myxococcales bacterium]
MWRRGLAEYPVEQIRDDFPILATTMNNKPLVYLDSGASAQKPRCVVDAMSAFYLNDYANIHRGVYRLSQRATDLHDQARSKVRKFIGAKSDKEVIFVRNATEGINLVAHSFGRAFLKAGDEIILSAAEHHANIVPWQLLRDDIGVVLKVAPITERGELELNVFLDLFSDRTRLVAMTHVSNALGSIFPIADVIRLSHDRGVPVLVDGCQAVPHQPVDVVQLDADFYVFSGHKLYGPSGVGVLYGKSTWLNKMRPYQGGGDMIETVTFEKTTYAPLPAKFEAGTPDIAGAIGLGAALDYVSAVGINRIEAYEQDLLRFATEQLLSLDGLRIVGTANNKAGIVSFVLTGVHPHDVGTILDQQGIAVRAGHHCAQPVMDFFGVPATVRASFGLYTSKNDIIALVDGIRVVQEIFG